MSSDGLLPPTAENEDTDESQSRSFGNFLPSLPSSKGIAAAAIGIGAVANPEFNSEKPYLRPQIDHLLQDSWGREVHH